MEEGSRKVSTLVDRSSKDPKDRGEVVKSEENRQLLNRSAATANRAVVARLKYLGSSEIRVPVKELGRDVITPTQASWIKMKGYSDT